MRSVCVFCGSKTKVRPAYARAAEHLAEELVARGQRLVYGGSRMGLMGTVADAVLRLGGEAVGVVPRLLMRQEVVHPGLDELHVVGSMHARKAKMEALSDGFISLPGGLGTWEETLEMLTWRQLEIHDKPCGLLNVLGYFDPITELFDHGRREGFLRGRPRSFLLMNESPAELLDEMDAERAAQDESQWPVLRQA